MPTSLPLPVASASAILTRLLSSAPLMRADHFGSWVRELVAGDRPAERQLLAVQAAEDDDEDRYVAPWDRPIYSVLEGVAIVDVSGPVVKGYDAITCWYFGLMSSDRLQEACAELEGRSDVDTVIFKFNSPGGMAQGTPETAAAIAQLAAPGKLTVAFTDTMCCSAAYYMASQCEAIFATLTADVGSIGTYMAFYDWTEYLAKEGIKLELFAEGTYKGLGMLGNPLSDEQRAFLKTEVKRTNERFLAAVRAGRPGVSDATMQGQWFDGEAALEAKLIDGVVPSFSALIEQIYAEREQLAAAPAV